MDEHGTVGRRSENPSRSVQLEAATRRGLFRSLRAIWPLAVFLTAIALTCVIPGAIAGLAGVAVSRDVKAALTRTECPAKADGFMKSANLWLHRFKGTCDATLPETANVHLEKRKYLGFVEGNSNYVDFAALFSWASRQLPPVDADAIPAKAAVVLRREQRWPYARFGLDTTLRVRSGYAAKSETSYPTSTGISLQSLGSIRCCSRRVCAGCSRARGSALTRAECTRPYAYENGRPGLSYFDRTWTGYSRRALAPFQGNRELQSTPKRTSAGYSTGCKMGRVRRHSFDRWQMHSLLLACAFLPWTAYYWSLDRVFGDPRYYWSTLTVHVLWGFTWFRLSVPLFRVARRFNRHRFGRRHCAGRRA